MNEERSKRASTAHDVEASSGVPCMTSVDLEDDGPTQEYKGSVSRSADQRNQQVRSLIPWLPSGVLPASPFAEACRLLGLESALSSGCPFGGFWFVFKSSPRSETFANQVMIKTSRTIGVGPSDKFKQGTVGAVMPKGLGAVMLRALFGNGPSCPSALEPSCSVHSLKLGRHARVHWSRHAPCPAAPGRHARAGHRTRSPANAGA